MKRVNNKYGKLLLEYLGKWIALSSDECTVVASGKTLAETIKKARQTNEKNPIYVMVSEKISCYVSA